MTEPRSLERSGAGRSANEVRAQLRDTLEVLDGRRHQLLDPKTQLRAHRTGIAIALLGVGALVGIGALVGWAIHRASARGRRSRAQRLRARREALKRAYRNPEWMAKRPVRREDVVAAVAKNALSTTLSFAAFSFAASSARRALESARAPAPRREGTNLTRRL